MQISKRIVKTFLFGIHKNKIDVDMYDCTTGTRVMLTAFLVFDKNNLMCAFTESHLFDFNFRFSIYILTIFVIPNVFQLKL